MDELSVNELLVDELSVDELSWGKFSYNLQIVILPITGKDRFLDVLELRRVEEGSDHSFHDSDLRSDAEREQHREEEKAPEGLKVRLYVD